MMKSFPGLDSIRALAAFSVVGTHAAFYSGFYATGGFLGTASARLDIGVALFFVLSGFLLSSPFLVKTSKNKKIPEVGHYLFKRALRILPLYWVAVALAMTLLPDNATAGASQWAKNLTLTQIYFPGLQSQGLTQMWSLCTEVAFYLLLPVLMISFARRTKRHGWSARFIFSLLVIGVVFNLLWSYFVTPRYSTMGLWLPAYLSWFAAGIFLALARIEIVKNPASIAWLRQIASQPGTAWTIALGLFAVSATPIAGPVLLAPPEGFQAIAKNLLYAVISLLIVLPTVLGERKNSRYHRLMSNPFLRHLGHISYGVFALHMIVLDFMAPRIGYELFRGDGLEIFVLILGITLVLAEISYRLIEKPIMRFKNFSFRSIDKASSAPMQTEATH